MQHSTITNPYASPVASTDESRVHHGRQGAPIEVELTSKGPVRRGWELRGGVEATLEWNALWITEYVSLNGRRVATHQPFFFATSVEFDFETPYATVAGKVAIRLSRFVPIFVRGIRVMMDDATIYQEGSW